MVSGRCLRPMNGVVSNSPYRRCSRRPPEKPGNPTCSSCGARQIAHLQAAIKPFRARRWARADLRDKRGVQLRDRAPELPEQGSMRHTRVIVTHYGGPDALRVVEEECPEPKNGEVRVRVLAAGVSLPDVMMREGIHPETPSLPFTPGWDLVGVVERLGDGVSGIEPGQIVAALPISGAYAEFVCLPQRELVPVPSGLDAAEAVSLVLNYVTAYQMLHRSVKVRPGQRVLIHGAAGGVGTALLQLGRLAGLEMYGTCSPRGAAAVSALGAIPIDYASGLRDRNSPPHKRRRRRCLRRHRWCPHLAIPQRSPCWRESGGLWSCFLAAWAGIGFKSSRSASTLSWNHYLRLLHRRRLASPGPETGGPLQHPDAQAAETGTVSPGFDRPA